MTATGAKPAPRRYVYTNKLPWQRKEEDILSGVVVALTSTPASINFALIAGVSPLLGIWSSVIQGLVSSASGAHPGLIAGAASVVVVPLGPLIKNHGVAFLGPTIFLAAMIEGLFSIFKFGRYVDLVDDNVLKGFLNGLGCLLMKSQIEVFAGLDGILPLLAAVAVSSFTFAVTTFLPRFTTAFPSALAGITIASVASVVLRLPVVRLRDVSGAGTFAGGLGVIPPFHSPFGLLRKVPCTLCTLKIIVPVAVSIAMISSLESLLAGKVVTDIQEKKRQKELNDFSSKNDLLGAPDPAAFDMTETMTKKNNGLLAALCVGNTLSACFGGFGGSGLIPQTVLNMKSGGSTRLSTFSYASAMAFMVVAMAPALGSIPLAALSAVMLTVAFSTVQGEYTFGVFRTAFGKKEDRREGGKQRLAALMATSIVCLLVDMGAGIGIGVAMTKLFGLIGEQKVQPDLYPSEI